jgi:Cdc6-like AAA superfamily ATPase
LAPHCIGFNHYTVNDTVCILKQRAEYGLTPNTWDDKTLESIAELSDGSAWTAIQLLRHAAQRAEYDGSERIQARHIKEGWSKVKEVEKPDLLYKLTEDHRLIHQLIKNNKGIHSGQLWNAYLKECKHHTLKPVCKKTFTNYINELLRLCLIKAKSARVKGRVRSFEIVD